MLFKVSKARFQLIRCLSMKVLVHFDEESLNKAIDTLIDLQKSGRMIGVISHVEELKAAFPAILEVRKSREGHSNTKFLLNKIEEYSTCICLQVC